MFSPRALGALAISFAFACSQSAIAQEAAGIAAIAFGQSHALSDDGLVAVGQDDVYPWDEAFRWDASSGQVGLGHLVISGVDGSDAFGVSADGNFVVGWTNVESFGDPVRAFRWNKTGPTTGKMTMLPYSGDWTSESRAHDVSDDGMVAVGVGDSVVTGNNVPRAFVWTGFNSARDIGPANNLTSESAAWGVSGDGKVIVGQCNAETPSAHAFRWTAETGMVDLGALTTPLEKSIANAVSRNGSVIVGNSGTKAFIKRDSGAMTELPPFILGQSAEANDVSFDGRVVVGRINGRAAIWIDDQPNYLSDLLASFGVLSSTEWNALDEIHGCSADGRAVVGDGRHKTLSGNVVFRAYLPLPNRLPTITSSEIDPGERITVKLGKTFAATVTARDPDLETMTLSQTGLPVAATFDPPLGTSKKSPLTTTVTFTPGVNHAGTEFDAAIQFTDAPGDTASLPFTIVVPPNEIPTVAAISPRTVECDGSNRIVLDTLVGDVDSHQRLTVEWFVDNVKKKTQSNLQPGNFATFEYSYPDGESTVRVKVTDSYDTVNSSTTITIVDSTDPRIIFTPTLEIPTDKGVDFATRPKLPKPRVEDLCDGDPELTNDAPDILPLGEHVVNWTATDADGNVATARQTLIVTDMEAPAIVTGSDVKKTVDRGQTYATIRLPRATATDNVDDTLTVKDNSRSRYPIGVTKVTYTCRDDDGNIGKATLRVEVVNRRPTANAGPNIVVETRSENGALVKLDGSRSSDPDGHTLKYRWSARGVRINNTTALRPQGTFPIGRTNVTLTVTDEGGAKHSDTVTVTVRLKGGGGRRSAGVAANDAFNAASSSAASNLRSGAVNDASVAGYRYAAAADHFGLAAGEYVRWEEGQSEADGVAAYSELRYAQAIYGSEAADRLLRAFVETGDENALDAVLSAARGVQAASADLLSD